MKKSVLWCVVCIIGAIVLWRESYTVAADNPTGGGNTLLGKSIFDAKCVECHGKDGRGNGPAAAFLNPRPRDLTAGKFKLRSTESGSIPTDDDLINTIQKGMHGTTMPDWKPFINGDSLQGLLAYVKSFSARFQNEVPHIVKVGNRVASSQASIEAGAKVFEKLQCASCHGSDGKGKGAVATGFEDDWGHEIKATNLTEPWTFRGGSTPNDVYLRFRTGMDGSPMPSFIGSATEQEMWNLANYVVSLARKPVWEMNESELTAFFAMHDESDKQHPVDRGKYLVDALGCADCHSPIRGDGSMIEELRLAGGQRWDLYPFDNVVSYNLTSDKETGLGNWTDEQIKAFVTKGIRRNGSRMIPYPMPWAALASLKEEDLNAIIAYLRSVPPTYNKIPDPKSPNIFSYMWGKFELLILKKAIPLRVYPGNAGTTRDKAVSANDVQSHQATKEARP